MKKLLNRNPTEEMCIAAREKTGVSANAAEHIFMAMFDAAPERDKTVISELGVIKDNNSYILGLLDAKLEGENALDVMRMVWANDPARLSGAIDGIRQMMILIEDKIVMAEDEG